MIYYIIWFICIVLFVYFGRKLFSKPKIQNTQKYVLDDKRIYIIIDVLNKCKDDNKALDILVKTYDNIVEGDNLDISFLELSNVLYERFLDGQVSYRVVIITRRLAHVLYRKYRAANSNYKREEFIQSVD